MSQNGHPGGAGEQPEEQPKRHGAEHLAKHKWKPGQSGNPSGRPRGRKSLLQAMQESLDELAPEAWITAGNAEPGETVRDVLARNVVRAAVLDPLNSGASQMMRAIMDREDPKNTRLQIESGTIASLAAAVAAIEEADPDALEKLLTEAPEG